LVRTPPGPNPQQQTPPPTQPAAILTSIPHQRPGIDLTKLCFGPKNFMETFLSIVLQIHNISSKKVGTVKKNYLFLKLKILY
jgi:hypothetical protein